MLLVKCPELFNCIQTWNNYLNYLNTMNEADETVISEKARAEKIIELLKLANISA